MFSKVRNGGVSNHLWRVLLLLPTSYSDYYSDCYEGMGIDQTLSTIGFVCIVRWGWGPWQCVRERVIALVLSRSDSQLLSSTN